MLTGAVRRSGRDAAIKLAADGAKIVLNCKVKKDADGVAAGIIRKAAHAMVRWLTIWMKWVDRMFAAIVNNMAGSVLFGQQCG